MLLAHAACLTADSLLLHSCRHVCARVSTPPEPQPHLCAPTCGRPLPPRNCCNRRHWVPAALPCQGVPQLLKVLMGQSLFAATAARGVKGEQAGEQVHCHLTRCAKPAEQRRRPVTDSREQQALCSSQGSAIQLPGFIDTHVPTARSSNKTVVLVCQHAETAHNL